MLKTIFSFGSNATQQIFEKGSSPKLPQDIQKTARRKIRMINNSITLEDLRIPPANRLEKLKGNLAEYYSIRINNQYRIIFKWLENRAYDVTICDYH